MSTTLLLFFQGTIVCKYQRQSFTILTYSDRKFTPAPESEVKQQVAVGAFHESFAVYADRLEEHLDGHQDLNVYQGGVHLMEE